MKRKALSLLMALCLMLTLAPAAFAVQADGGRSPEVFDISPEDVKEVNLSTPMALSATEDSTQTGVTGTGTEADPYCIHDLAGFIRVVEVFGTNDYYGEKHFKLMADLDLSSSQAAGITPNEWGSYITYFHGVFDGNGHTITGIPKNRFLIMAWYDGTIKNLTVDMKGNAGTLVYSYFTVGGAFGTTEMSNVTVKSTTTTDGVVTNAPISLDSNDQANYAPFIFCSGPYFTMTGCTNYADITGVTYASVFYGYNPLPVNGYPSNASVNITNCTNHGNITLRYAGLVFGNPTYLNSTRGITISGLKNYGEIRGTESKHYFCSDAGSNLYTDGSYYKQMEDSIATTDMELVCDDANCSHIGTKGGLYDGTKLDGLSLSVDSDTKAFVVNAPTTEADAALVDHYVVTVYHYVNLLNSQGIKCGTDRISYSETISSTATTLATTGVFDCPLIDGTQPVGTYKEDKAWIGNYLYELFNMDDDVVAYWINNAVPVSTEGWNYYINSDRTAGSVQWKVYVSAYGQNGQLLDTASLVR